MPANHSRSAVRRSSGAGTLAIACGASPLFAASGRSASEQKSEGTLAVLPSVRDRAPQPGAERSHRGKQSALG